MHIIIPMSGVGKRFIDAGYMDPKPLIVIDGKPIIEHVCNLFPGETKFTFICNAQHLAETNMRSVLTSLKPGATIVEIPNHKQGPVYAVSLVENLIEDDEEVIVNYCDFGTYWDYADFLKHTRDRNADGAVPAYKGFHPHMLGSTNYAFMQSENQWMQKIKEKEPFTDNRMEEYASNGTYYFKKGAYVKKYFTELMNRNIDLNGEYYVSLVYNLLKEDGLNISIYEIQHMLQWGTPADVEEYNTWSNYFRHIIEKQETVEAPHKSVMLIPLAGRGSRFAKVGYADPKPLIKVSGKSMIIQAANCVPESEEHIFVCLDEHLDQYPLKQELLNHYPNATIVRLDHVTEGQAITCGIGLTGIDEEASLTIAATDNGMVYDKKQYRELVSKPDTDAVIWTFRHHQSSKNNPQMYGWVKASGDTVTDVSVKKQISDDPFNDHAIVGTFFFKKTKHFNDALQRLIDKNIRVNNEFYVDSLMGELIQMGLTVKLFEVNDYVCWGTPDDYETFVYWQSFFHKTTEHPYSLSKDITVNPASIAALDTQYRTFTQHYR